MCAAAQNKSVCLLILIYGGHWPTRAALPIIVNIYFQENTMNKDQAKGRIDEATGKMKEVAGKVTGNKELELKGTVQNIGGKIQAGLGDLKNDLDKASTKK